jgi:Tol biopolymer transport system component
LKIKIVSGLMLTLLLVSMLTLAFNIQPAKTSSESGLVGYWKFDEGSGTMAHDSSGNGNDGTIHTATWVTGKVGGALHFNGVDSWVEVPTSPTLTGFSQITLEAWIQEDSIPSRPNGIISKCDGWAPPTNAEYFLGTVDNGKVFFETDNSVAIFSSQSDRLITQTGRWYHVAGTWSGDSWAIYVNGVKVLSGTCTPQTTLSNTLPVQIGRHGSWPWVYFNGTIDEVKIYDCARTPEEIWDDWLVGAPAYLTDFVQLTTNPYPDRQPFWSPDGSKIAYFALSDSWYRHIWVMNSDGSGKTQLTFGNVVDESGSFSPDGTKIAFSRYGLRDIDGSDLMMMNADGTSIQQLTSTGLCRLTPKWSHNGQKLAFYYGGAGTNTNEIHIMNTDGTNEVTVVSSTYPYMEPSWSPDDAKLVYPQSDGIWLVSTSPPYEKTHLFTTSIPTFNPVFSPDGEYILYSQGEIGTPQNPIYQNLCLIDDNGNFIAQLTNNSMIDYPFDWSPNGQFIAFGSISSGNTDIWRAKIVIARAQVSLPWKDDFNYGTLDEMKAAGWTYNPNDVDLIQVGDGTVTITNDGARGPGVSFVGKFPSGIYDFVAETSAKRVDTSMGGIGIDIYTQKHTYSAGADGWTSDYRFIRDGVLLASIDGYTPLQNTWETIKLERTGNEFHLYINSELKLTYVETDDTPSPVTGVGLHSGWIVTIKYDYISLARRSQPTRTLTVYSSHDSPNPPNGDNTYVNGSSVTCNVTSPVTEGSTVWTCTGWSGTGSVPASGSGTTVTFTITQNSSITWNWQGQAVQRKLTVNSAHDSPVPGVGDNYFGDGSSVTCSVSSTVIEGNTVWTCTGWTGTGSVPSSGSGTSMSFTITQGSTITWNWQGTPVQRTLTVSSAHDSPVPGNGPHTYSDGQSVTCSVTSPVTEGNTFWTCTGWTGTGSVPPSGVGKKVTFTITQDSSITWNWQGQATYSVTIGAHCNTEGRDVSVSVWIDSSTMYYTPYTFTNLHGSHTFTASQYDASSHSFKQWNTGSTSLTITVSSGGTYTAYYEALSHTLTVSSAHDSPVPSNGPHTYTDGQSVACSVSSTVTEGSTIWTCTGWSGTGSVPSSGSGTSVSFTINRDSTITWNWQARSIGDLILVDFSPVQVVYGASELVANKPAVFRAIVQSTFSQYESTIIRFTYSGGSSTDYPLTIGPNTQMTVFIPFASGSLRQRGTFTWTARLDPDNQIVETNEGNNMVTDSKTVIETNYLRILYVPLRSSLDSPVSAGDLKLMELYGDQYVFETFPTPGVWSQISSSVVLAYDNSITLYGTLSNIDGAARQAGFDRTVVILPNRNGHWLVNRILGWFTDAPACVPTGFSTICLVENGYYAAIPHELAHTYGRPGGLSEEYRVNPPGNAAAGYDPGRGVKIEHGLCFMGATVPFMKLGDSIPSFTIPNDNRIYGPYPGGYWICNTCFEALLRQLKIAGDPEIMYMGGIIFENNTALLPSWSRISNGVPDVPLGNNGNLKILFLDDTDNVIGQTGLNVSSVYLPGEFITPFSFTVEYPAATRKIQLLLNDDLIVEKYVTLNPPTVQVVSPNGGEVITAGEDYLISWNSSDLDGDQLTNNLFYSSDGGGHWVPIAFDLNGTNFLWNTSNLMRGSDYLLRIIANDGLNTGEDISNGTFTVKSHDIETVGILSSKTLVGEGYDLTLNVTITNEGDFPETCNVTLYGKRAGALGNGAIGMRTAVLASNQTATLTFMWNTAGFAYGNYTISAYATPVLGETDLGDNTYTYGTIKITIPGDINGSGRVTWEDLSILGPAYGSKPGDVNWNPNADIDSSGRVNWLDLSILGLNYGKSC